MTERNKAVALRWSEELWSGGHLAVADEIVAPGYVRHDPGDPFPAHGKTVRTPAIQIFRFSNGKIVESWAARDDLGTLRQLGRLPAAEGVAHR